MDLESIARNIEDFTAEPGGMLVFEDGVPVFDLSSARYSLSTGQGRCLLHLWSEERNVVRSVLNAEHKQDVLKLTVQRFGRTRPTTLELCRAADRRSPSLRKRARTAYAERLRRVLERSHGGFTLEKLSTSMDLSRSFGPAYTRVLLRQGSSAIAALGVNREEAQSTVDAALTFGILWLDFCRSRQSHGYAGYGGYVEALELYVPAGRAAVVRERMAHLDPGMAKWRLFELDESSNGHPQPVDCSDRGNLATRLVHIVDPAAARERFAAAIQQIRQWAPCAESAVLSPGELSFRVHGLEFARVRAKAEPGSFRHGQEIVFGLGASETVLDSGNEPRLASLARRLCESRHVGGDRNDPLWRMAPERWLESMVARQPAALDSRLDPQAIYPQVPAFSASDRSMIDLLAAGGDGQLAVLELKASEDIHLPLQGLDYWARVAWHQERGELQRFGYFSQRILSPRKPRLLLVAPALQVHPATDTLLRYLSPEIDCELIGIDERWREELRVVFRKRAARN